MDEIGRERLVHFEQPAPGSIDVALGAGHPFQREAAMNQRETFDRCRSQRLLRRGRRSEDREHHLDARSGEVLRQLDGEMPDAADGVGGHQHPPRQGARRAHAASASSSASGRGRSS
jgi:hypothetical protein